MKFASGFAWMATRGMQLMQVSCLSTSGWHEYMHALSQAGQRPWQINIGSDVASARTMHSRLPAMYLVLRSLRMCERAMQTRLGKAALGIGIHGMTVKHDRSGSDATRIKSPL